jgi:hypothetical protein
MTWSDRFREYIERRFGMGAQQKASFSLKVAPSKVHYWCHGATARVAMRKRVARWSGGEVPAEISVPEPQDSGPALSDTADADALAPTPTGTG